MRLLSVERFPPWRFIFVRSCMRLSLQCQCSAYIYVSMHAHEACAAGDEAKRAPVSWSLFGHLFPLWTTRSRVRGMSCQIGGPSPATRRFKFRSLRRVQCQSTKSAATGDGYAPIPGGCSGDGCYGGRWQLPHLRAAPQELEVGCAARVRVPPVGAGEAGDRRGRLCQSRGRPDAEGGSARRRSGAP